MDFRLYRRDKALYLGSGFIMNGLFLMFLIMDVVYTGRNWPPNLWDLVLFLIALTGSTYRETWCFTPEGTEYRFTLFFLILKREFYSREETVGIGLSAFIRGENGWKDPDGERLWFQKEQGMLRLELKGGEDVLLHAGTNRKTGRLRDWGEEIARYREIPFRINEKDPA